MNLYFVIEIETLDTLHKNNFKNVSYPKKSQSDDKDENRHDDYLRNFPKDYYFISLVFGNSYLK